MNKSRAEHQDIRPLKIVILNLMPLKVSTETDLLRLLSNTPLQIEIDFLKIAGHTPKNTPVEHMTAFYKSFEELGKENYDGMIITGAPVEHLQFEQVVYWTELQKIFEWAKHHVTSTMFICWAAQAGLYHHYKVPKYTLNKKVFGVFEHSLSDNKLPILRSFDDKFFAPHSRYSEIRKEDIEKVEGLDVVSVSDEAGVYMVTGNNGREIYVTGHPEYSRNTLNLEYNRDLEKNLPINIPSNYYPDNDPLKSPLLQWRSHANMLFANWLNYYVYQETPYNARDINW
jgi:homoserine O-succinyltransferase